MSAVNLIKNMIPNSIRPHVKQISFRVFEFGDRLFKGRNNLIPPQSIQYVGGKNQFLIAGKEFFEFFKELGHLKPDDAVLDIGCGTGRMAYPLTTFLSSRGRYVGFDIVPHAIDWCKGRYEHQFSNFFFYLADLYNSDYNPRGKIKGAQYRFEHKDAEFDFIFATSVFTHMLPDESQNYLNETRRVLKPSGRALLTFFVLNDESKAQLAAGKAIVPLKYKMNGFYTSTPDCPENAVGYEQEDLLKMLDRAGLELEGPIHFGDWCRREKFLSHQDILIVRASR